MEMKDSTDVASSLDEVASEDLLLMLHAMITHYAKRLNMSPIKLIARLATLFHEIGPDTEKAAPDGNQEAARA